MTTKLVTKHNHEIRVVREPIDVDGNTVIQLQTKIQHPHGTKEYATDLTLENVRELRKICDEFLGD